MQGRTTELDPPVPLGVSQVARCGDVDRAFVRRSTWSGMIDAVAGYGGRVDGDGDGPIRSANPGRPLRR